MKLYLCNHEFNCCSGSCDGFEHNCITIKDRVFKYDDYGIYIYYVYNKEFLKRML